MYFRSRMENNALLIEVVFWLRGQARVHRSKVLVGNMKDRAERVNYIRIARKQLRENVAFEVKAAGDVATRWFTPDEALWLTKRKLLTIVRPFNQPIFARDPKPGELDVFTNWPLGTDGPPLKVVFKGRKNEDDEKEIHYDFYNENAVEK